MDFTNGNKKDTLTLNQGMKFKKAQSKILKNGERKSGHQGRPQKLLNTKEGLENQSQSDDYLQKRQDLINTVDNTVILQVQQLKDLQNNYKTVLDKYNTSVGNLNNATQTYIKESNGMSNYENTNIFVDRLISKPSEIIGTYKGSYNTNPKSMTSLGTGKDYSSCKTTALDSGYSIFGLQNTTPDQNTGAECVGSNDLNSAIAGGVYKSRCSTGSDGNTYGGPWTNAVYSIDPVNKSKSYVGCYGDTDIRAMSFNGPQMDKYQSVYAVNNPIWPISNFPKDTGAQWIWYTDNAETGAPVNIGTPVTLIYNYINNTGSIIDVILWGVCDDYADIYINSQLVGSISAGWDGYGSVTQLPLQIMPGNNYIEAAVINGGGPAGLIMAAIPKGAVLKPEPIVLNSTPQTYTLIDNNANGWCKGASVSGVGYVSKDKCQIACDNDTTCTGYDIGRVNANGDLDCYLWKGDLSVAGSSSTNNGCYKKNTSTDIQGSSKQYTATIGSTFWGKGGLYQSSNGTMQQCVDLCAGDPTCTGATYNPSDHGAPHCWIQKGEGPIGGGITNDYAIVPGDNSNFSNSSSVLFKTDNTWKWTNIPPSEMVPGSQNYSVDTCKSYAEQNGYPYFGVQNGDAGTSQCFVSNDLANAKKYGSVDNSFKLGDGNIYGGKDVTAVYDTGMGSNIGLLGKMGYINETGKLSEYPSNMFDPNTLTINNNSSCNKNVNKIDTRAWSSYTNTGVMMTPDTKCALTNATTRQSSETELLRQQLSDIAQQIVDKISYLETLNISMLNQMGMDKTVLDTDLEQYKKVVMDLNGLKNNTMAHVNGVLADTETNVLMENYNYMFWGILALAIIIITIRSMK